MHKRLLLKLTVIISMVLLIGLGSSVSGADEKGAGTSSANKYFVAHQGGFIGEATVSVNGKNEVVSAELNEWQGPSGWAEYNNESGNKLADGAVVRVPDPLANKRNSDPQIKGYMFYILQVKGGIQTWSQYTPTKDGFIRPKRHYERDFTGLMTNPMRAKAYAEAAKADTLVNVTIEGNKVIVGAPASKTVHYGHMNKTNPQSTYMPISIQSIGFRYNNAALIAFFKANPTADYSSFSYVEDKITLTADPSIDAKGDINKYKQEKDKIFQVVDAVTGATFSDFPHYALELQEAYKAAVAARYVDFK